MRVIASVQFLPDGAVSVSYMDLSTDVRNRQLLSMSHELLVSRGEDGRDYGDEIDELTAAAKRLLDDALEDWGTTTDVGIPFEQLEIDDE